MPQVLAGLRQLQPRLYSISSSQAEAETRVQVRACTALNCHLMLQTVAHRCAGAERRQAHSKPAWQIDMRLS
jgi:hypothetical protein